MHNEHNNQTDNNAHPALLSQLAKDLLAAEALSRSLIASGKAPGPKTGFDKFDREINGYLHAGIHTLLAAPGAGKTAFALQIAANCGCPALYVTSEMSSLDLMRRVISRVTRTFCGRLSGGTLSEAELSALITKTAEAVPMLAFMDSTEAVASPLAIIEAAEALKARFNSPHVLIIVDSVTDWALAVAMASNATGPGMEYQAIEAALTALKQLSGHLHCPVLCVAHKNRSGQSKAESEALFTGKGTGRFEYVSETVWALDCPDEKANNLETQKKVTLTLAKNRHGIKGATIPFTFEGRLMEFTQSGGLL